MPVYSFKCADCRKLFDINASYSEYKKGGHACPKCGGTHVERDFRKVAVDSFLRGEGWAGKLIKENAYRKKRSAEMDQRMRERHTTPKLTPNVGGEVVGSWEEASKLARAKKVADTTIFERKAHEAKAEKKRPKGVQKRIF